MNVQQHVQALLASLRCTQVPLARDSERGIERLGNLELDLTETVKARQIHQQLVTRGVLKANDTLHCIVQGQRVEVPLDSDRDLRPLIRHGAFSQFVVSSPLTAEQILKQVLHAPNKTSNSPPCSDQELLQILRNDLKLPSLAQEIEKAIIVKAHQQRENAQRQLQLQLIWQLRMRAQKDTELARRFNSLIEENSKEKASIMAARVEPTIRLLLQRRSTERLMRQLVELLQSVSPPTSGGTPDAQNNNNSNSNANNNNKANSNSNKSSADRKKRPRERRHEQSQEQPRAKKPHTQPAISTLAETPSPGSDNDSSPTPLTALDKSDDVFRVNDPLSLGGGDDIGLAGLGDLGMSSEFF
ncbi:MAG: hypothetical protein MHM6MM_005832 [Cercozoa sp. M6MM]